MELFDDIKLIRRLKKTKFLTYLNTRQVAEPLMLFISFVRRQEYAFYKEHPALAYQREIPEYPRLIEELRTKGYRAVDIDSPLAADPSTLLVSPRGIRTPFIVPEKIKNLANDLVNDLINSSYVAPLSYMQGLTLSEQGELPDYDHNYRSLFPGYQHPHPEKFKQILATHGEDFMWRMVQKAYQQRQSAAWLRQIIPEFKKENLVMTAQTQALGAYENNHFNQDEGRMAKYGACRMDDALKFAGMDFNELKGPERFTFLVVTISEAGQVWVKEFGMESSMKYSLTVQDYFETPVIPESNKYLATFLVFADGQEMFEIPEHDPEWEDFKELFRGCHIPYNDFVRQRYQTCWEQQRKFKRVVTYDMFSGKEFFPTKERDFSQNLNKMRQKVQEITGNSISQIWRPKPKKQTIAAHLQTIGNLIETLRQIKMNEKKHVSKQENKKQTKLPIPDNDMPR